MSEEFRAIKANELDECIDLWGKVFVVGRDYFPPYFYGDPWYKRAYTRVCAVDGKLVSAIQVCERRVRVGDAEIVMGGIGNVATYEEYRGRGYSQRLLSDCAKVMHDHCIDFSVLFTGIMPFYEKILWRSVPQRMFNGKLRTGLQAVSGGKYTIRTCDWASDLPAIQRICDVFNQGRALTTVRTPEYWGGYLPTRFGKPESTLVAECKSEVVGYLHFGLSKPNCWLREIGYLHGHEACADVLIRETAVRALQDENEVVFANLPHEPEILTALNSVATDLESREPMGMMCRITNIHSLAQRLQPELTCRAQANKSPDGAISLDTELGGLRFTIANGQVSLGARNPVRVPVSQLEFFCLLFGIKDVGELGMSIPDGAAGIIETIFTRQRPVFWLPDHF